MELFIILILILLAVTFILLIKITFFILGAIFSLAVPILVIVGAWYIIKQLTK